MTESLQDLVVAALGDQYAIECEIGRGGMAVVYRARDLRLNRPVAIKVLPPELAYDVAIRMRFTREAQTSAQLAHPSIVPIFDVGERDGIAYFVMGLVTGGHLGHLLADEPQLPFDEVRRLLGEVCDALAYAHQRGVIHRDIKPDNILIDADSGRALVTDFGIARAMEAGARLTVTGNAVGTPTYMSPEQATGEREVDGRSDVYSVGVLAYQMLTGRVPFTAGNSMALLLKHVSERPRPIAELRPEVPKPLQDAVERALRKAPEDRWPGADALRDALTSARPAPSWRAGNRDPVRFDSPVPTVARKDSRAGKRRTPARDEPAIAAAAVQAAGATRPDAGATLVLEPPHLAQLTAEERADLRLWHGQVNLMDRVKTVRWYVWYTLGMLVAAITTLTIGVQEGVPPAVLAPLVPMYMSRKLWRRSKSLRAAGFKLRRVFLMPRAKWVIPGPPKPPKPPTPPKAPKPQLSKLAPREVLDGPEGFVLRRAAEDQAAIVALVKKLPKADRAALPDVELTAKALLERAAELAQAIHRLDESFDPAQSPDLEARIREVESEPASLEGEHRLTLLRRQRETVQGLVDRRAQLRRQLDSAGLALGNLRLDLIKYRSSGMQSALSDLSHATREARALSRDMGYAIEAAEEMRGL